jgi:hypothetical protein
MSKDIVRELETRWTTNKPGIEEALSKVMGWTDGQTDLRIHLLGLLATKTDEQIQQEAEEMVRALETVAHTSNMTQMGEDIMIDVVRLCTIVISREDGIMTTKKEDESKGQATEEERRETDRQTDRQRHQTIQPHHQPLQPQQQGDREDAGQGQQHQPEVGAVS